MFVLVAVVLLVRAALDKAPADDSGGAGDEVARPCAEYSTRSRRRIFSRHRGLMLASVAENGQPQGMHLGATPGRSPRCHLGKELHGGLRIAQLGRRWSW